MRDLADLFVHLLRTIARLMGPGGARAVVAESLLIRQQLLVLNRPRRRAPNLRRALVKRKYRLLFSVKRWSKSGPKGPSPELIATIVEMKKNPRLGCRRIAQQISFIFGIEIDKDVVRRVLAKHFRPEPGPGGLSWLTFLSHIKGSLWSLDLFRCESLVLKIHWVVVMYQYTRRMVGFAVHAGVLDEPAVCRMFNRIPTGTAGSRYLSSDNDPMFEFHCWKANLRILDIAEVKTVPYAPLSHPFVERLVGSVRREVGIKRLYHLRRSIRAAALTNNQCRRITFTTPVSQVLADNRKKFVSQKG